MYNYKEAVKEDVRTWIEENREMVVSLSEMAIDMHELCDQLRDRMYDSDAVTGNGSGSYTLSSYKARVYVMDDHTGSNYLQDMVEEGLLEPETVGEWFVSGCWESLDVCIRCYLLTDAVMEVMEEDGI